MYNPLSVVRAFSAKQFQQYWVVTGTYGDIDDLINKNFDGFPESLCGYAGEILLVGIDAIYNRLINILVTQV